MAQAIMTKQQELDIEAKQRGFGVALARTEGNEAARTRVLSAMDEWEAGLVVKFGVAQVKTVLYEDCE